MVSLKAMAGGTLFSVAALFVGSLLLGFAPRCLGKVVVNFGIAKVIL
jgi:hypothetical protein